MTGGDRASRPRSPLGVLAVVALFVVAPAMGVFAGVTSWGLGGLFGPSRVAEQTPGPTPASPRAQVAVPPITRDQSAQDLYVQSVAVDRQTMHIGNASARIRDYAEVRQVFEVDLLVCGPKATKCGAAAPGPRPSATAGVEALPTPVRGLPGPRATPSPLGQVLTGGRVRATLTALHPAIQVRGGEPATQLVLAREDVGEWRWSLQADRPGTFDLAVMVVALRGESDEALTPPRYFDFTVEVSDTFSNRAVGATRNINSFLAAGGAGLATLVTAGVGVLAYRRGLAHQPVRESPTPGTRRVQSIVLADERIRRRRRTDVWQRRRRPSRAASDDPPAP